MSNNYSTGPLCNHAVDSCCSSSGWCGNVASGHCDAGSTDCSGCQPTELSYVGCHNNARKAAAGLAVSGSATYTLAQCRAEAVESGAHFFAMHDPSRQVVVLLCHAGALQCFRAVPRGAGPWSSTVDLDP